MEELQDKTLVCKDCGTEFVFTVGEQQFYAEKDLQMSHKDAQIVEKQENNNVIILTIIKKSS